jgi:hypothetical protein
MVWPIIAFINRQEIKFIDRKQARLLVGISKLVEVKNNRNPLAAQCVSGASRAI